MNSQTTCIAVCVYQIVFATRVMLMKNISLIAIIVSVFLFYILCHTYNLSDRSIVILIMNSNTVRFIGTRRVWWTITRAFESKPSKITVSDRDILGNHGFIEMCLVRSSGFYRDMLGTNGLIDMCSVARFLYRYSILWSNRYGTWFW